MIGESATRKGERAKKVPKYMQYDVIAPTHRTQTMLPSHPPRHPNRRYVYPHQGTPGQLGRTHTNCQGTPEVLILTQPEYILLTQSSATTTPLSPFWLSLPSRPMVFFRRPPIPLLPSLPEQLKGPSSGHGRALMWRRARVTGESPREGGVARRRWVRAYRLTRTIMACSASISARPIRISPISRRKCWGDCKFQGSCCTA